MNDSRLRCFFESKKLCSCHFTNKSRYPVYGSQSRQEVGPLQLRGNICKHLVQVLLMVRSDIAEGTIARFCGRQDGNAQGGMGRVLRTVINNDRTCGVPLPVSTPKQTLAKKKTATTDVSETLRQLVFDLSNEVTRDPMLIVNLVADLNQVID